MSQTSPFAGTAQFSSIGRDLYWKVHVAGEIIRWTGYDDRYWWDNVSVSTCFQIRKSERGVFYRLNPETDKVLELVEPREEASTQRRAQA